MKRIDLKGTTIVTPKSVQRNKAGRRVIIAIIAIVGTTSVVTTATAATAVIAIATVTTRSGGFLILEARDGKGDLATIVNTLHDHLNGDRKSTRLNSSHSGESRMPSSA